jgi:predicted TIM-barrel fold metal-dependent hydrolase
MPWIDVHCHLFTDATADETTARLPGNRLNTASDYLSAFAPEHKPTATVVVDFSKAKSSAHVIASLADLEAADHEARGVIRANIHDDNTLPWLLHPHVAGARLYALEGVPDLSLKDKWNPLFNRLRQRGQHLCLFGKPANLRETLRLLPNDLPVLIDHLGMPDANESTNQADYAQLLADCVSRMRTAAPVYFKGPGYRTALEAKRVAPFVSLILDKLGETQLLLGASDAPFAGPVMEKTPRYANQPYQQHIGYDSIVSYLETLARIAADFRSKSEEMLLTQWLYSNARQLYGFANAQRNAA